MGLLLYILTPPFPPSLNENSDPATAWDLMKYVLRANIKSIIDRRILT